MKITNRVSKFLMQLACACISVTGVSAFAQSRPDFNLQTQGHQAIATWGEPDSCGFFYTTVIASENMALTPGAPSGSGAILRVNAENYCAGTTASGDGSTSGVQFSAAANDSSATLSATIPISICSFAPGTGYTCANHAAVVKLSWSATDKVTVGNIIQVIRLGSSGTTTHNVGRYAPATASGSVTLEDGTALISGDSVSGDIESVEYGSTSIH
jgi:hypothetical protein